MTEFFNLVVGGLVTGALYSILAAGLALTYQTSGVFNFGQGGVAFATAYLFFQLNTGQHIPVVPAALISIVVFAPLLGYGLHWALFRGLRDAPVAAKMVAALGLLIALPALCLWIVALLNDKAHMKLPSIELVYSIPGLGPNPRITWTPVSGLVIDSNQVAMLAAAALSATVLWYVVRHTRLGLEMRACVSRPALASLRGIDPDRSSAVSWILTCTLAGLAGVLLAPLFTLSPAQYNVLLFVAIPAVVLGRLRSIPVAVVGGLLLGVAQNLVAGYVDLAKSVVGFTTAVPFIILFALLFILAADRSRRTGVQTEERAPADYLSDLPTWRRRAPWVVSVIALTIYAMVFASGFWTALLAKGLATTLVLLSFTVVTGIGGMVSLAQASFVLAGAFTAGQLIDKGVPFLPAALAGTAVAAAVGIVVALPTRRLGGLPLALATLALAYVGENLLFQLQEISNGSEGWPVPRPKLGPFDANDPRTLYVLMLVLVLLVILLIRNLMNSPSGRAMLAVRSTESGAVTSGVAAGSTKLIVFAISAAIAGFGGVMLACANRRVTNLDYPVLLGLIWLATTITFSVRRPGGALLAGVAGAALPQAFNSVPSSALLLQVLFGLGAINLARNPDGLLAIIAEERRAKRDKKAAAAATAATAGAMARTAAGTDAAPAGVEASGLPAQTPPVEVREPDRALQTATASVDGERAVEPATEAVLRLSGVRAGYDGVPALHGVDLAVHRGEAVGLLGANGAGKSTLCAVVGGLLPTMAGSVELLGSDVTGQPAHQRSRRGLFLAPEGRGIVPDLTVEENLALWLRGSDERTAAYDAFPILGERRGLMAGALSGGEQQMLTLAPALVRPPAVLVADEPSLGLAPLIVERIFAALRELHERGTALLVAEEKTRDVLALADRVAFLTVGRLTWTGLRADLDENRLAEAYLGISADPDGQDRAPDRGLEGARTAAAPAGSAVHAAGSGVQSAGSAVQSAGSAVQSAGTAG